MCAELNVPLLGKVPLDPCLAQSCDEGGNFIQEFLESPATKAFIEIVSSKYIEVEDGGTGKG